jgi:3',5'-cyclic AMP phosphodiesterase CpdA
MSKETPQGSRLLTLLHISDLHLAVPTPSQGGKPPKLWRHSKIFDGLLGHNEDALEDLEAIAIQLKRERSRLLVTGDLTSCGRDTEFALAAQFLQDKINLAGGRSTGLQVKDALLHAIPGNHDQWSGVASPLGPGKRDLSGVFPDMPIKPIRIYLKKGRWLTILGIDSDADIQTWSDDRVRARGEFMSQINTLSTSTKRCDRKEIRVLLVHHSPLHQGELLSVKAYSRGGLWNLVKQRGISVILTGHVHAPAAAITAVTHKDKTWNVLEARCGTSSQTDEIPNEWAGYGSADPTRFPLNSVLIHRLYENKNRITWHCDAVPRTDGGYLISNSRPLTTPVEVWPR